MPTFTITHNLLTDLGSVNQFELPQSEIIFVGLRGAITADANDQAFGGQQVLNVVDINYTNPRCTILQWRPQSKDIAAFPASTVPNQINVQKALSGGDNANCLLTGFYKDYQKGIHKAGTATAHDAFRQNAVHPFRRTADDLDFEKDDRIEYDNPHDNIHCGWFQSLSSTNFASAGCQVIMGYPKCRRPGRDRNIGPWRVFSENAYSIRQDSFPYILVTGQEMFNLSNRRPTSAKLRFGSSGDKVKIMQQALKDLTPDSMYEGAVDGDFGQRTMKAVVSFQQQRFGTDGTDGIVGPITAEELGIDLTL